MNKLLLSTVTVACMITPVFSQATKSGDDVPKGLIEFFKPKQAHAPGTIVFPIFAREYLLKEGEKVKRNTPRVVTAWEFVPSKKEKPLVKRCVFATSDWLPRSVHRIPNPNVIRLQYKDGKSWPYAVRLYGIDYSNWDIQTYHEGAQAVGLAQSGDIHYMKIDNIPKILNTKTGKFSDSEVIEVLKKNSKSWLVKLSGKPDRYGLINPKSGEVIKEFMNFPKTGLYYSRIAVDSTENHVIVFGEFTNYLAHDAGGFLGAGLHLDEDSPINQKITLFDVKTDTSKYFMTTVYARAGSGVAVISNGSEIYLTGKELRFTCLAKDKKHKFKKEWVVVDIKTKKEIKRIPYSSWKKPSTKTSDNAKKAYASPAHLAGLMKILPRRKNYGNYDLALAAMVYHKILDIEVIIKNSRQFDFKLMTLSPDNNHLILSYKDSFYYFDLVGKTHRVVLMPPTLRKAYMYSMGVKIP